MAFLSIKNIVKNYGNQRALNDVSIDIEEGELVSILGPSGCGKTTLLRCIAGLETVDSGKIFIGGKDCTSLPPSKRNFGIVFQSYALFPHMTIEENILFGLNEQKNLTKKEKYDRCQEVLEMVDLVAHRYKYPHQLSGGQQQRIALARAISLKLAFLLLDEPLSALDAKVREKLRLEICRIQRQLNITTIMVTHDQEEALTMADKIVVMNNSVIEQVATPKEIYKQPQSAFVANFIGTINFYKKYDLLYGIRPENIQISKNQEQKPDMECWHGTIDKIEFRGAFTRVYANLQDTKEAICVDVESKKSREMNLQEKSNVFFEIPKSEIIYYPVNK